jgi:hypothetical protein
VGLSLIEELLLAGSAEVAGYRPPLRALARLSALSTRVARGRPSGPVRLLIDPAGRLDLNLS